MKNHQYLIPFYFTILLFFTGCKKDKYATWNTRNLVPLAYGKLNIKNLDKEDYLIENDNKELEFVYSYNFGSLKIDSALKIPDTTITKTVNLKTLTLGKRVITEEITFGQVAHNLGDTGKYLTSNQGKKIIVPGVSGFSLGSSEINATNLFENATFKDGDLTIELKNNFPVDLTNVEFELQNASDNSTIVTDKIPVIPAKSTKSETYPLKNKTVDGILKVNITSISTPGSNGNVVRIDTNDALVVNIIAENLDVLSAKARFPAQYLVNDSDDVEYDMGGPEFRYIKIKSGYIKITTIHTIPDSLHITYEIPSAFHNGVSPLIKRTAPPAPEGDSTTIVEIYPLKDHEIFLDRTSKYLFNAFTNTLKLAIDSSGKLIDISLKDSIKIIYGLYDVVPEYAEGKLGNETFRIGPNRSTLDLFNDIKAESLELEDLNFDLTLVNGVGASASLSFDQLSATNTRNNVTKSMVSNDLKNIFINPAKRNPFEPSINTISFNKANSNSTNLLEILPDVFTSDVTATLNPGNDNSDNFIFFDSKIEARGEVSFPVSLKAKNLVVYDTTDFTLSSNEDIEQLEQLNLKVITYNGFPLSADVQIYFLNDDNVILDSLTSTKLTIEPGKLSDVTNRVEEPSKTIQNIGIDKVRLEKLKKSKKIIIKGVFNTKPGNEFIKIYSTYDLSVKLVADFIYQTNFN